MADLEQKKFWSDLRVGLITFLAIVIVIAGVALSGGNKGLLLRKTAIVKAWLFDVGGLKTGCSVTMNGMIVGKVNDISFILDSVKNQIEVTMEVRSDFRSRVKSDSVPTVRTQGLLGDRYIDISAGSETSEPLPEGTPLKGEDAADFDKTLREATAVLNETHEVLNAINERRGTVGQLFYDEGLYQRVSEILTEINDILKDFKKNPKKYINLSVF